MKSENLKRFLSLPVVTIGIIIVAIAVRIFFQIYFLSITNDKSYQILAAQNFLAGNGFTLHEVLVDDLSQSAYVPLIKWPPGYSLLLTPFLAFCKNNVVLATLLLDAITCIFFIIFTRKLLLRFSLPIWLVNIYTLVSGFFLYSFCLASSTDFLTLTIFIIAIYYSLKLSAAENLKPGLLLFISVLLFFTGFVRYLYLPVAFVIPFCFIVNGLFNKNKLLLKKGIGIFILTSILITTFLVVQATFAGGAAYTRAAEKGFFIDSAYQLQPFIFTSLFNLDYFVSKLIVVTGLPQQTVTVILIAIHHTILFFLLLLFIKWLLKKRFLNQSPINLYLFISTIASLVILAVLLFLSITNAPHKTGVATEWTYVHESRYFAFPVFFLQQLLFITIYHYRKFAKKWLRYLLFFCFFLLLLDTAHNIYFTTSRLFSSSKRLSENIKGNAVADYIDKTVKKVVSENPGKKVIVIPAPAYLGSQAGFYQKVPALYHYDSLNKTNPKTSKEVVVLFITNRPTDSPVKFETNTSKKLIGSYNELLFYTLNVKPE